mgnify:CR=1 FL=1
MESKRLPTSRGKDSREIREIKHVHLITIVIFALIVISVRGEEASREKFFKKGNSGASRLEASRKKRRERDLDIFSG